ncbi:MAG: RHS repeat-associated core domain-containing protein, partial [Burkholderiales bacterium]
AQSTRTDRGYTGHEHIDDIGLIHMNGRLYDPITGRMMSADPIIQAPYLLQNYNRYSYVMNNPLSLTDPSGFSWWTRHRRTIGAIAAIIIFRELGAHYAAQAATASEAAQTLAFFNSMGAFAAGGINGGNFESAVTAGITAGLNMAAGEFLAGSNVPGGSGGAVAIHAVIGCTGASISGGDCGRGAMSAGFAELSIPAIHSMTDDFYLRATMAAAAGGIGSRLAGGNFTDGFMSGAFSYLYNCDQHGCGTTAPEEGHGPAPTGGKTLSEILPFTEAGDRAATLYAERVVNTTFWQDPMARAGLALASLWTPTTAGTTFLTLGAPLAGGAVAGSVNQWVRVGQSYSVTGKISVDLSLRWGASPARNGKYVNMIPEWSGMRSLNQGLREFKLPLSNWRAQDAGHFHIIRTWPWK